MPVKENQQTPEEQRREAKNIQAKEDELAESLLSSLDLTTQNDEAKDKSAEGGKVNSRRPKEEEKEEVEEEDQPEASEDEPEQESEESEEEEDEEVIPKSKFQKRLDSEIAKRKILEAEVAELKAKNESKPTTRQDQLEALSEAELKQLKAEAKAEWKRTDDPKRERELDELIDEIEKVVKNAPDRFVEKQAKAYEIEANKIMSEYDDIDFEKESAKIKEIATNIYKKYPDLQKLERGQATALRMAVEHYAEIRKTSQVKSKETDLKRKLTNVKRKTSLDSGSIKGSPDKASRNKDYDRAKKGGLDEKTHYFTEHVIDVNKYLPAELR